MDDDTAVYVAFDGGRSGSAPLTWGQRGIWDAIRRNPPGHFNQGSGMAVPEDAGEIGVAEVARAIGLVVARHESLRTRVRPVDGEPHQVVAASGRLPLRVAEASPESAPQTAEALLKALLGKEFDDAEEWPVRPGVVTVDGRARAVVLAYSHVAVDVRSMQIVARDLEQLLRPGGTLGPPGLQPMDLAREQRADNGRRTRAAIKYWSGMFREIPAATFTPVGPAHDPPYRFVVLVSAALLLATRIVAARHRATTSTVLLAATAALIGEYTGHRRVAISTVASNRFQARVRDVVSALDQNGLFVLDLPDDPALHDLVPRAWSSAMRAYRHASYDQAALDQALERVYRERGTEVNPFCCFNDVRTAFADEPTADWSDVDETELRRAEARTRLVWRPDPGPMRCRFCLRVFDAPDALGFQLIADTRCMPPDRMEAFLLDLERMVVAAALAEH